MGMSTHVEGFKAPDAKWKQMKTVWDACRAAEIGVPEEVDDYFEGEDPDHFGVTVEIEGTECCKEWSDEYNRVGFEVELKKIPKGVTHIRFYNSW